MQAMATSLVEQAQGRAGEPGGGGDRVRGRGRGPWSGSSRDTAGTSQSWSAAQPAARPGGGAERRLGTECASDEIKGTRQFGLPGPASRAVHDPHPGEAARGIPRSATGALGQLGAAVGGTSLHYNAKTPRFWKQDFTQLSDLGPVEGAQVADWPLTYDDLAPFTTSS